MEDFKINTLTIEVIYRAVRVGGGSAWSGNAKLKAFGERAHVKNVANRPHNDLGRLEKSTWRVCRYVSSRRTHRTIIVFNWALLYQSRH
jgi:hypothetical protein